MAFNRESGDKTWEQTTGGKFPGAPAFAAGRLVIAADNGIIFCFGIK